VERAPDRGIRCPLGRSTRDSEQSDKNEAAEERNKDTQRFVQQVRSTTRRKYTVEEKIHLVLEGFRREVTVNELCRREGIKPDNFYSWTKESMEEGKQCILIIIGVTANGIKKFVAIEDGYRESEHSWLMTFRDLKQRGLKIGVELAVGDGASGFWKVLPRYMDRPALSVAGFTRPKTCSSACPRASNPKLVATDMDGADQGTNSSSFRSPHGYAQGQTTQGNRASKEGPRSAVGLL